MSEETGRAIVLGGKTGLLGRPLTDALARAGFTVWATTRNELDPGDAAAVAKGLADFSASHLFNTVAYTAVDKAEDEPEAAYRLNRDLPLSLGRACGEADVAFVHYSTDFVFDGAKGAPYVEEDAPNPESVYGASKLAGEQAVLALGLPRVQILRTAWLYGPGKKNFVATILHLARECEVVRVVHDQIGSPTFTVDLAGWSAALARTEATGLFHAAGSGEASWCELATEAVIAAALPCRVVPIPSAEYPQQAKRPPYSVLDTGKLARTIGREPRPWIQTVREYVYALSTASTD
jgi:dTDP-4-dehydrorhamnose reductase